jgi:hypothetical protein
VTTAEAVGPSPPDPESRSFERAGVLCCEMKKEIEFTRLVADLQARAIVHHHILMQLVRREARASSDSRAYLSELTDDLTRIADQSLPLEDTRVAAMSMRQYLDEFLVAAGVDLLNARRT